ncbi:MAG: O-antigen ligase family protein [Oligoflexia bacterium]|nr:O-antigen ligase family protein [Oligoflexia bacterium]
MPKLFRSLPEERRQRLLALGFAVYLASSLVSMAVMSLGAGLLVLAMLFSSTDRFAGLWERLRAEARLPAGRLFLRLSLLLAGACALSLVAAWLWPPGYGGRFVKVSFARDLPKLWYLFWPLVLAAGLRALPETGRSLAGRSWLLAFAAVSAVAYVQYFTGWPRMQWIPGSEPARYHATLFIGHHLSVASILIFPFFAALEGLHDPTRARALGLSRAALAAIVLLGAGALFLTHARTVWVAVPVGLLVWSLWRLPRKWCLAAGAGVALAIVLLAQQPAIRSRFTAGNLSYSLNTRVELWKANLRFFEERPLLGAGWRHNHELSGYYQLAELEARGRTGESVFSGHAHNNLIDFLGGTGLIGALAWLAWCFGAFWLAWRARDAGIFCAWIVFNLNGITQMNFWDGKVAHQAMIAVAWTLLAAAVADRRKA